MSELEKAFLELREANTKYSIQLLELEKENARLREALKEIKVNGNYPDSNIARQALKGSEVFILKRNSDEDMKPVMKFLKIKEGSEE